MHPILSALGYGLMVAIVCAILCAIACLFHRMELGFILGLCIGTGVCNAVMYYFGLLG